MVAPGLDVCIIVQQIFTYSYSLPPSHEQRLPPHPINDVLLLETCFGPRNARGCEHGQRPFFCLYNLEIAMGKSCAEWPLSL